MIDELIHYLFNDDEYIKDEQENNHNILHESYLDDECNNCFNRHTCGRCFYDEYYDKYFKIPIEK